ncbi:hypothetical protein CB0940_02443 [Cercospora beticola]|uniref:Uncharacterized protein n=1 Tax=Cercospora beticola TaxID=122368 RepID=A0A2G5I254_CERBT|nr:hypothetical protein CB0940_02443 [Cercospora beticola]PIA98876.1 hypothetical protein CB0940_02443 [Cercospora beticola]WPA99577.1 hypothetical protein RHO25_004195 [Cercospora beticola]
MSTGNPNYGVGGTAQDGGLSTADTVRDGGPDGGNRGSDDSYVPSSEGGRQTRSKTSAIASDVSAREGKSSNEVRQAVLDGNAASGGNGAHVGNPNRNVGGTAGDGGVSTADTVADGGPNPAEEDSTYKP